MREPANLPGRPLLHRTVACSAAFAAFVLAQWLTLGNPGYFSHDELQWGAAAAAVPFDFVDWRDLSAFQYRPLTFNLWLLLSRALFANPAAFHALWLAFGFAVCALLFIAMRRVRIDARVAAIVTAAFALNPFAVYVHGWVATLGELLWTACALSIAICVLGAEKTAWRRPATAAFALTLMALLSKEAALAIAPLLALAWLLSQRERRWAAAFAGSALPTLAYLALRLPVLLHAPRPDGAYSWSLLMIPQRWAEIQAYPFLTTALEMNAVGNASVTRLAFAIVVASLVVWSVLRADLRVAALYLFGGAIAIGPAIVLQAGYPQYGYAFSALACACLGATWPRTTATGRSVLLFALLLSTWHGANVQREMRRVGEIEAVFSPALRELLAETSSDPLILAASRDAWIYRRLTEHLPHATQRIVIVTAPAPAGFRIAENGAIAR